MKSVLLVVKSVPRALFFIVMSALATTAQAQAEPSTELAQGVAAFEQRDMPAAARYFNRVVEQAEQPEQQAQAFVYLAKIALTDGDIDQAEEQIERAIEHAPDYAPAYFERGAIMGAQAGQSFFSALGYAKKSRQSFARAVELEPNNIKYRDGLMKFYLMAPGIAGGDSDLAWQQVEAIQQLDAHAGLIAELDYLRMNADQDEFEARLVTALNSEQVSAELYFLAGLNAQQQQAAEQAMDYFQQAIDREARAEKEQNARLQAMYHLGRTAAVRDRLAQARYEQGAEALQNYLAKVANAPELPSAEWATLRLAQLQARLGNTTAAQQLREQLLDTTDTELANQLADFTP